MQITNIKIDKFYEDDPIKAIVSITFEKQIQVHNIKIIKSSLNNDLFVIMPAHEDPNDPDCYCDTVDTVDDEFRTFIETEIITAYKTALNTLKLH